MEKEEWEKRRDNVQYGTIRKLLAWKSRKASRKPDDTSLQGNLVPEALQSIMKLHVSKLQRHSHWSTTRVHDGANFQQICPVLE